MLIDERLPEASFVGIVSVEIDAEPEQVWALLPKLPILLQPAGIADWALRAAAWIRRDAGAGADRIGPLELRVGAVLPVPERYGTTPTSIVALEDGREVVLEGGHKFARFFTNLYLEPLPHGRTRLFNVTRADFASTPVGRIYRLGVQVLHGALVKPALLKVKRIAEAPAAQLPPGQRARSDLPRFGLPISVLRWPRIPERPTIEVSGEVSDAFDLQLEELASLDRREQRSDLHCVTTWSRLGVRWSGYPFLAFYELVVVPRAMPHAEVRYIAFKGLDGVRTELPLADALADDVLLADRLDDEPLSIAHGAPIRLVAPTHYGYKSIKHLCSIELLLEPHRRVTLLDHPRARVAHEERGRLLPGRLLRHLYRPTVSPIGHLARRTSRKHGE